jgi:hypothetical protein
MTLEKRLMNGVMRVMNRERRVVTLGKRVMTLDKAETAKLEKFRVCSEKDVILGCFATNLKIMKKIFFGDKMNTYV